jgi:hypothetical protein
VLQATWQRTSKDWRLARVQAWRWAGDTHATKPGTQSWIAEMYGYVFAAAKHDVWHLPDHVSEYPPGIDFPLGTTPRVLHYCMDHQVETKDGTRYQFIKHWHHDFDATTCPDVKAGENSLFPHPPAPSELPHAVRPLVLHVAFGGVPLVCTAAFDVQHA